MKKRSKTLELSVRDRRTFTAIKKGRRFIYYPTTPYYLRRICDIVKDYYEVRDFKKIKLSSRTGVMTFVVEDIIITNRRGAPEFKIYLGDVIEREDINEHAKRQDRKKPAPSVQRAGRTIEEIFSCI